MIYYLRVFDNKTGRLVGQLVDITTQGMKLTSQHPVETNASFELRMVLPDTINGERKITFDTESIWCTKDINPKYYSIGFEFRQISQRDIKKVENLIMEFSFEN